MGPGGGQQSTSPPLHSMHDALPSYSLLPGHLAHSKHAWRDWARGSQLYEALSVPGETGLVGVNCTALSVPGETGLGGVNFMRLLACLERLG